MIGFIEVAKLMKYYIGIRTISARTYFNIHYLLTGRRGSWNNYQPE